MQSTTAGCRPLPESLARDEFGQREQSTKSPLPDAVLGREGGRERGEGGEGRREGGREGRV